jgi:thioesterase domain-containing protein
VQFIAQEEPISTRVFEDPRLSWRDLCQGEFQVHYVRAAHNTLFSEPHAIEIAAILRELLRNANDGKPQEPVAVQFITSNGS